MIINISGANHTNSHQIEQILGMCGLAQFGEWLEEGTYETLDVLQSTTGALDAELIGMLTILSRHFVITIKHRDNL